MLEFRNKFRIEDLLIKRVGGWNISLRPVQITLGALILSLDRPCPDMGGLTFDESLELGEAFKVIQNLFTQTFKPDKINYLALMMVDHQVHFHVIPRYESERVFEEEKFADRDWPNPPDLFCSLELDSARIDRLKEIFVLNTKGK